MKGIAIITGASSGIGEAAARAFTKDGWAVIGISRRSCVVAGVLSLHSDLSAPDFGSALKPNLDRALNSLLEGKTNTPLCLVHNAARLHPDTALTINPDELNKTLQLNVVAPAVLNTLLAERLPPGSSILYIGSTLSEKAIPGAASYVLSKHAVAGLMRATCQDLAGKHVHTACICPGFVDTPMLRERSGNDEATMREFASMATYDRILQPQEIAELLLRVAMMPWLNGSVIHANYGQIER